MDMLFPLRYLVSWFYRQAPYKLGGWEGADDSDICAALTSISAVHWRMFDHMEECAMRIQRAEDSWVAAVAISVLTLIIVSLLLSVPSMLRESLGVLVSCCCGCGRGGGVPREQPPPAGPVPFAKQEEPASAKAKRELTDEEKDRRRESRRTNDATKNRNADIARWAETFVHYLASLPPETTIGTMLQSYRTPLMDYFPRLANEPAHADAQHGGDRLAMLGAAARARTSSE